MKKNLFFKSLLAAIGLLFAVSANATDEITFTKDGLIFNNFVKGGISTNEVRTYNNRNDRNPAMSVSGAVVIPDVVEYNGTTYKVVEIGAHSFLNDDKIVSVVVGNNVTTISDDAFGGCTNLVSVKLPSSVRIIGSGVFDTWIKTVTCDNSILPSLTSVSPVAFKNAAGVSLYVPADALAAYQSNSPWNSCASIASISSAPVTNISISGDDTSIKLGLSMQLTATVSPTSSSDILWASSNYNVVQVSSTGLVKTISEGSATIYAIAKEGGYTASYGLSVITNPDDYSLDGNNSITVKEGVELSTVTASLGTVKSNAITELFITGEYLTTSSINELKTSYFPNLAKVHLTLKTEQTTISSYQNCSLLTEIIVPDNVTSISTGAFRGCSNLESMTLPFIGTSASATTSDDKRFGVIFGTTQFNGSTNTYPFYVPDALKYVKITGGDIYEKAFYECTNLTTVILPNSITSIPQAAFGWSGIQELTIPEGVTSIGTQAFCQCKQLTTVNLPSTLKTIGSSAFAYSTIKNLSIPNCVTSISDAFKNCTALETISIPNTVTSLKEGLLMGCSNLISVTLPYAGSSSTATDTRLGYIFGDTSFDGSVSTSQNGKNYNFPSTLRQVTITGGNILDNTFYNCTGLTHIKIENAVINGIRWCYGCTNLKDVNILSSTISELGYGAFQGCSNLASIEMPDDLTTIGSNAFYGCSGLTSVTIPNSVTSIGSSAFGTCSRLVTLNFNAINCTTCGNAVLSNALTTLNIGNKVTIIPAYAFYGCKKIKTINIPASVTTIGANAFNMSNSEDIQTVNLLGTTDLVSLSDATAFDYACMIYVDKDLLDGYKSAQYWTEHASQLAALGVKQDWIVTVAANDNMSDIHRVIGEDNLIGVVSLKVKGTINSYDLMIMRNKMPNLQNLDLEEARIVANPYEYYTGYCSVDDTWTNYAMPTNIRTLKLPKTLKQINTGALTNLPKLTNLVVPASVETIQEKAAYKNTCIQKVTFEEGSQLTSMGESAFQESGLVSIDLSNTKLTSLAGQTFYNCKSLQSVNLKNNLLTTIGQFVFDFSSLQSLTIPSTVTKIGGNNRNPLPSLKKLTFEDGEDDLIIGSYFENSPIEYLYLGRTLRFYTADRNFSFATCEQNYKKTIVTIEVGEYVRELPIFWSSTNPNTATTTTLKIKNLESWLKLNLTTETAPFAHTDSSTRKMYLNDVEITNLTIPAGTTKINDYAFYGVTSLQKVTVPSSVESIGTNAFTNCTSLELCTLPTDSKVTDIATSSFEGCSKLQKMSLPTSVQTIGATAFQNCTAMSEVKIPSSIRSIGNKAFYGCNALLDVYTYTLEPQVINQETFSTYTTANLHVPAVSFYNYYYDTQWSQFLKLLNFDEPYDYVYVDRDFTIYTDQSTGIIKGCPRTDISAGGSIIVDGSEKQVLGDIHTAFDVETQKGASLIGGSNNLEATNLYIDINVKKDYWHFFCFPFNVDLTKIQKEGSYVFRRYDSSMRAADGSGGWRDFDNKTLQAGKGYIFRTNTAGILSIPIAAPNLAAQDESTTLETYDGNGNATAANKNWNFAGNRYLSYYNINDLNYEAPIVVWNGQTYVAYRPGDDDFTLTPFQAFFVQKPDGVSNVGFSTEGRTTHLQSQNTANNAKKRMAKARRLNSERKLINLAITNGDKTDHTRIVFNDKQSMDYELGCDASKFLSGEAVPQLYSLDKKGTKYAINERPLDNGEVSLGFVACQEGEYTLQASRQDVSVLLYDNTEGEVIDLSEGAYTFHSEAGTFNNRFCIVKKAEEATGVNAATLTTADSENLYDLTGRKAQSTKTGVVIKNGKKVLVK